MLVVASPNCVDILEPLSAHLFFACCVLSQTLVCVFRYHTWFQFYFELIGAPFELRFF
jgi:hypothetical protein